MHAQAQPMTAGSSPCPQAGARRRVLVVDDYRDAARVLNLLLGALGHDVRTAECDEQALELAALTGWGADEDRRRSHEAGFDHHLVKPVDARSLQALLA